MTPRLWRPNYLVSGASALASSSTPEWPASQALTDQSLGFRWQTLPGWTITADNNILDFNRGGVKVATIVNGYYATGAAMATAVQSALNTADTGFTVTYSFSGSADKFVISRATTFSLLTLTGANKYRSIARSLGYSEAADLTGATGYTGGVCYQSTHFLRIILTAAQAALGVSAVAIVDSNLGIDEDTGIEGGTWIVQSNSSDSWASPAFSTDLTGQRKAYLPSSRTDRFWRITVDNTANPDGYFRVGVIYLGSYIEAPNFSSNQTRKAFDFTQVNQALTGQHAIVQHGKQKRYALEIPAVGTAEADALREFLAALSVGENRIIDFDPSSSSAWLYGYQPAEHSETFVVLDYWTFSFPFFEAL